MKKTKAIHPPDISGTLLHLSNQKRLLLLAFLALFVTGCHQYELRRVDRYTDGSSGNLPTNCNCHNSRVRKTAHVEPELQTRKVGSGVALDNQTEAFYNRKHNSDHDIELVEHRVETTPQQVATEPQEKSSNRHPPVAAAQPRIASSESNKLPIRSSQSRVGSDLPLSPASDAQGVATSVISVTDLASGDGSPRLMVDPLKLQPAREGAPAIVVPAENLDPPLAEYPISLQAPVNTQQKTAVPLATDPEVIPAQHLNPVPQPVYQQPIEFRGTDLSQPQFKLATQRLVEVLDENEKLKVMLSTSEEKNQALQKELLEARHTIISANYTVNATLQTIDGLKQTINERNAQIEQMHSLLREHESNTTARLNRLTDSVRRSVQGESKSKSSTDFNVDSHETAQPPQKTQTIQSPPAIPQPAKLLPAPDSNRKPPEPNQTQTNNRGRKNTRLASEPVPIGSDSPLLSLGKPEIDVSLIPAPNRDRPALTYFDSNSRQADAYPGSMKPESTERSESDVETSSMFAPDSVHVRISDGGINEIR